MHGFQAMAPTILDEVGPTTDGLVRKAEPSGLCLSILERVSTDMVPFLSKFEEPGFEFGYLCSLFDSDLSQAPRTRYRPSSGNG